MVFEISKKKKKRNIYSIYLKKTYKFLLLDLFYSFFFYY